MARNLNVPYTDEKTYYFISYNSEDEREVKEYAMALSKLNVPIWYDNGLKVGGAWEEEIAEKIENCEAVIMFLSKNIFEKEKSYVHKEFELATVYSKKTVYVFMLDEIDKPDVPLRFRSWWISVTSLQCVNTYEYDSSEECIGKFVESVKINLQSVVEDKNEEKIDTIWQEPQKNEVIHRESIKQEVIYNEQQKKDDVKINTIRMQIFTYLKSHQQGSSRSEIYNFCRLFDETLKYVYLCEILWDILKTGRVYINDKKYFLSNDFAKTNKFRMVVKDVVCLAKGGWYVTCEVESGTVDVGDWLCLNDEYVFIAYLESVAAHTGSEVKIFVDLGPRNLKVGDVAYSVE